MISREIELSPSDTTSLLDDETNAWDPPTDLDGFFRDAYHYHSRKGMTGTFLTPVYQLLLHTFVIGITGIGIACIDWVALSNVDGSVDLSDFVDFTRVSSGAPAVLSSIYLILTIGYISWRLFIIISSIPRWVRIHKFYRESLEVEVVSETTWPGIVRKISELQRRGPRLVLNKDIIEPVDVAIRILRTENYMVSLMQNNVLKCPRVDDVVVWNIWWTLLGPMFSETSWKLSISTQSFRTRCKLLILLNLLLMPLTLTLRICYLVLKSAELAASPRPSIEIREWSPKAYWVAREFNEYQYLIEERLRKSSKSANKYLFLYPSSSSRRACSVIKFITGSIVGCITLLAAFQDEALVHLHVGGRNMLWWLGIFSATFAAARLLQPPFCRYSPTDLNKALDTLKKDMKYYPQEWGQIHHRHVQKELATLYPFFFVEWFQSLKSIVTMPLTLAKWAEDAESIVDFVKSRTLWNTCHGDICQQSLMDHVPGDSDREKGSMSYHSFHEEHSGENMSASLLEVS